MDHSSDRQQLPPPTSPQSIRPTHIHSCRWDWCRLTFSSNVLLVHHVVHEHVHKAQPVRRHDVPLLRRAEEGLGESWRLSTSTDNQQSTFPSDSNNHASSLTSSHSLRSFQRARMESPSHDEHSSQTEGHSQLQADLQARSKVEQMAPSTSSPSHAAPASLSQFDSVKSQLTSSNPRSSTPSSPAQSQPYSPGRTSFAQRSSEDGLPSDSMNAHLPSAPSYNSQEANAVGALTSGFSIKFKGRGKYGRNSGGDPDASPAKSQSHLHANLRPSTSPSPTSHRNRKERRMLHERVEQELTQGADSDVDMDVVGERDLEPAPASMPVSVDKGVNINQVSGIGILTIPISTSTLSSQTNDSLHSLASVSQSAEGGQTELVADLEWPEDMEIPNRFTDNSLRYQSQSPSQQGDWQLPSVSQPSGTSVLSVPLVLQTQSSWYRAPSRSSSLSRTTDPQQHTSQPSPSLARDPDRTSNQSQIQKQNHLRTRKLKSSFRSGSMRVRKGPKKSSSHNDNANGGPSGNGSGSETGIQEQAVVDVDADASRATAQSQSQESQDSGSGSGGYGHSYFQLQTQAPYQSQSFSQSLSETSAG